MNAIWSFSSKEPFNEYIDPPGAFNAHKGILSIVVTTYFL